MPVEIVRAAADDRPPPGQARGGAPVEQRRGARGHRGRRGRSRSHLPIRAGPTAVGSRAAWHDASSAAWRSSRRSSSLPSSSRKLGLPPPVVEAVVGNSAGAAARLRGPRRAGAVRHGRRLHDRLRPDRRVRAHASRPGCPIPQHPRPRSRRRRRSGSARATRTGRLVPGLDADIAVVEGNPEQDIRALGRVRYTFRGGRLIYRRAP